jgi:hypothetical protein
VAAPGLAFVSVFFVALAALYVSGSSLLDNDDVALAALGTLLASIVALVVVSGAIALSAWVCGVIIDFLSMFARCRGRSSDVSARDSSQLRRQSGPRTSSSPLWTLVAVLISLLSLRVHRDSRDVRSPGLAQNSPSVGP